MVGGEPPRWLLELETISRTFGLELIESVLANHFKLFKAVKFFDYQSKKFLNFLL